MDFLSTDRAPAAVGPYSQAVKSGRLLFCSGQIGLVPGSGALADGGVSAQTEQALKNLAAVLKAAGLGLHDVVKTTVFVADIKEFAAVNDVYAKHFGSHKPARSTVQATALPLGALVEIDAIAVFP